MKLALNTSVLTPKGFRNFQSLMVDDLVINKDGVEEAIEVIDNTSTDMVELTLSNGEIIITAVDQEFDTIVGNKKSKMTAQDILDSTKSIFLPAIKEPLEFSEKYTEINPYLLGLWFGMGSFDRGRLLVKGEHANHIREFLLDNRISIKTDIVNNKTKFHFLTFEGLDEAIVFNNLKEDRHIPSKYLHNLKDKRLGLLMGIMDSMSTTTDNKTFIIKDEKSPQFLKDLKTLLASFGLIATIDGPELSFETNMQLHSFPSKLNEMTKKTYKYKVESKRMLSNETHTKDIKVSSMIVGDSLIGI